VHNPFLHIYKLLLLITLVVWQGNVIAMNFLCAKDCSTQQGFAEQAQPHEHYLNVSDDPSAHSHQPDEKNHHSLDSCCTLSCSTSCSAGLTPRIEDVADHKFTRFESSIFNHYLLFHSGYITPPYRPPIV